MHEEEKFYALMALVCRKLPHYAVQMTVDAGYLAPGDDAKARKQYLHEVKRARITNLAALAALVKHSLPQFEIPSHLLPEPVSAPTEQEITA